MVEYLTVIPAAVPAERVVVHNHVRMSRRRRLGSRGFRAWLDGPSDRYETCSCGWAPELGEHYRVVLGEHTPAQKGKRG